MTVAEALKNSQKRLKKAGIDSFEAEAMLLLGELTGLSRVDVLLKRDQSLTVQQKQTLQDWLRRRCRREPLQHILGKAHFYGLELLVSPAVLIPRPETETLVEIALKAIREIAAAKVLDIGTGSGAIALAIKHERPDAVVMASDISAAALELAWENARRLGLKLRLKQADLLDQPELRNFAREADLLISNPPYLPQTDIELLSPEVQAEPLSSLYSGAEGLEHFKRLEQAAFGILKKRAIFVLELDPRNSHKALALAERWPQRRLLKDLLGRERFLYLKR